VALIVTIFLGLLGHFESIGQLIHKAIGHTDWKSSRKSFGVAASG